MGLWVLAFACAWIAAIGERGIIGGESLTERESLRPFLRRFFVQGDVRVGFWLHLRHNITFNTSHFFSHTLFLKLPFLHPSHVGSRAEAGSSFFKEEAGRAVQTAGKPDDFEEGNQERNKQRYVVDKAGINSQKAIVYR